MYKRQIVVTRAREQASGLARSLTELGANVIQCPTIEISPLADYSELDAAVARLADYGWIIFTSVNGVRHFWKRLAACGRDSRAIGRCKVAAIGPATADALRERGIEPDFIPARYVAEGVVEGLLALGPVSGVKMLLPRAARAREVLPDDFRTALAGDSKEFRESSSSLMFAFILAIVLIYLILAAQFESFKDPLVIMLTVPLAIAGALVFMAANGQTMNIFSQIGIIMLIGLVAKNGILIVEFANQKQEAGIDKLHAIEEASLQRLRPILMTSASTILGLLPLTVATGEGANGRIAMGIAVVGGMVVSTLLTLYIVPAIYSYVSTDRSKKQK